MATISHLWVEHHRDALGIGEATPRLSWKVKTSSHGWTQSEYEIEIAKANSEPEIYHVKSDQSILAKWPSKPLASRENVTVRVRVTGSDSVKSEWSSPLAVEAGLLEASDWKCSLVEGPAAEDKTSPITPTLFKTDFTIGKIVAQARLHMTAHGIYDTELNGIPVGDHVLAPGWTSYAHELPYQTFDVTNHLQKGDNALGVYVGEGWWAGRLGWSSERHHWGDKLGVIALLHITYTDGSEETISSDKSWKYCTDGPVTRSEIYNGEDFDARQIEKSWSSPGKSSLAWKDVSVSGFDASILRSPDGPPIRRIEEIKPIDILKSPSGKTILDLGQNLVGWLKVKVNGPAGHVIKLVHTEVLEHGEVATRPLRAATATDHITLSGEEIIWEPRFTFHGFRYVEVTNWPDEKIAEDAIRAIVVHTDMERTGHFECSHDLINRLHSNILWSMRGNFVGIPTDCPQRDERLGWTGDIQAFAPTASFLYNSTGMLKNWLRNLASEVNENGVPPLVSPDVLKAWRDPEAIWSDALVFVPHDLYHATGDLVLLETQFASMQAWLSKGVIRDSTGLWKADDFQLGDWLDPAAPPDDPGNSRTDPYLVADAFLIASTDLMIKICKALGKAELVLRYTNEAAELRKVFEHRYITPSGRIVADSQTAIALAIHFNLIPTTSQQEVAASRLVQLIRKNSKFKIATGFAGTPIIGHALTKVNQTQVFYRMLYEKKCPSWLYPVTMDATTVWERWDSMLPDGSINPGEMTSFNHYALGAVADWMHKVIGGLSAVEPGWKKFNIKPVPGGDLTWARTRFESPYGSIRSEWDIVGDELKLTFSVPPNSSALVKLPGGEEKEYGSGEYEISIKYEKPEWPVRAIVHKYATPEDESI